MCWVGSNPFWKMVWPFSIISSLFSFISEPCFVWPPPCYTSCVYVRFGFKKLVEKRPWFRKNLNYVNRWRTLEVIKFHMFWVAFCNITYSQKSHLSDFHSSLYIDENLGLSRKKKAFLSYFAKLGLLVHLLSMLKSMQLPSRQEDLLLFLSFLCVFSVCIDIVIAKTGRCTMYYGSIVHLITTIYKSVRTFLNNAMLSLLDVSVFN